MEMTAATVISALSGRRMRHSVVCLKGEPEIAPRFGGGVEVHCLYSRPNELALPWRLRRLIRRLRPDVIHARNWGAWPDVAVARLMTLPCPPLIFSFHGLGKAGRMPLRRRVAFRVLARMTTVLLTVSEGSKRLMVEEYGWPTRRVEVIHNGVDTERFRPPDGARRDGPLRIAAVGNLRPVKNHAMLLRACAALAARGVDLELSIAGQGPLRADLEALATSSGIAGRLRLPGHIPDVPEFLRGADLFVLPSDSEQNPNALLEAMATGLPCVATDVGGVGELLDGGRCGRIVPPGDIHSLAAAIGELLADESLRRRLGAAARQRACQEYHLEKMIAAYERLYRRLAGRV
jgi:glycosyltransferase involved in cell wall biosynthesis